MPKISTEVLDKISEAIKYNKNTTSTPVNFDFDKYQI